MAMIELTGSAVHGIIENSSMKSAAAALPTRVCLGCNPPISKRAMPLQLSDYVNLAGAELPSSTNWREKAMPSLSRMYLNDQYGCCVFSGKAHNLGVWSANDSDSGGIVVCTDAEIKKQYFDYTGGRDAGANIEQVLRNMQRDGFVASGKRYKIDGFVSVDHRNRDLVKVAQLLFGATSIGMNLPSAWTNSDTWDVTNSRIVGGHDVSPCDYDDNYVYVSSWGRIYRMTWAAFMSTRWVGEYYAMLAPLWYGSDKIAPGMVNVEKLRQDLATIGGGGIPDIEPPEPPAPPVPAPPIYYAINLGSDLPAGPCTITTAAGDVVQANVSTARDAGTYLMNHYDPPPPQ